VRRDSCCHLLHWNRDKGSRSIHRQTGVDEDYLLQNDVPASFAVDHVVDKDLLLWEGSLLQTSDAVDVTAVVEATAKRRLLSICHQCDIDEDYLRGRVSCCETMPLCDCKVSGSTVKRPIVGPHSKEELHRSNDNTIDLCKLMS
jgi:hypothetical protein